MSVRTIVEINHDYLHDLREHPERIELLWTLLSSCDHQRLNDVAQPVPGIRFLGQRHHSDKLTITAD